MTTNTKTIATLVASIVILVLLLRLSFTDSAAFSQIVATLIPIIGGFLYVATHKKDNSNENDT